MNSPLRAFKARVFHAMAHPTRIAVLDALRGGERSAGALQAALGVEQANLSQHLAVLRNAEVVVTRKAANQVYYSLRDPVLTQVLDLLKQYFYSHLHQTAGLLGEMRRNDRRRA